MARLIIALAVFNILSPALADPRPVLSAKLTELRSPRGVSLPSPFMQHRLTLFKDKDKATRLDWMETSGPPPCKDGNICSMMPSTMRITQFRITKQQRTGCGSTRYSAIAKGETLTLIDHSQRLCKDFQEYPWQVTRQSRGKKPRFFGGNPEMLPDPNDCAALDDGIACIMLYAPAKCSIASIDGKPVSPPIVADGSNSCFAMAALRVAACERGYDTRDAEDAEVLCSVTSPPMCPIPMCIAPPEGCTIIYPKEADENECPKYPCGITQCL